MKSYQRSFIELALQAEVLKFGEFTLKSGRISPYFFNAGKFQTGRALAELGRYYAEALLHSGAEFDMVFGPAYKGIPLVSSLSIALADQHQRDLPYGYNRKEAKDHGEGGSLVGAPLAGKVAIVDDVITAGTAIRQVLELIKVAGARPAVIVVGLDRQERGQGDLSAIQEIERDTGIPVVSIVKLNDIIRFLQSRGDEQQLEAIVAYREKYGISEDT